MFHKNLELVKDFSKFFGRLVRRDKNNAFYFLLLIIFIVAIFINYAFDISNQKYDPASFDLAIKYRLSSPPPDQDVIILDVDERSLAAMADEYGRWPWPREVHAESLALLEDLEVAGIAFNIMFSDSDINNPDSDSLFDEISSDLEKTIFPFIRLNPENDNLSKLLIGSIGSATFDNVEVKEKTIAAVIPLFNGTRDKLGVSNLVPDDDGMIRRYTVNLSEQGFSIPSLASATVDLSKEKLNDLPKDEIILNWRNKNGNYKRISFSDFFLSEGEIPDITFDNKLIVYGVSAPGISSLKTTPAFALIDDNTVIATALDDMKNETHLSVLSKEFTAFLTIISIILLFFAFRGEKNVGKTSAFFGIAEVMLVMITFGSVSYTNYLLDLSQVFLISSFYFFIALAYHQAHVRAYRGAGKFPLANFEKIETNLLIVYGFYSEDMDEEKLIAFRRLLETATNPEQIIILDNAFSESNFIGNICNNFNFIAVLTNSGDVDERELDTRNGDIFNLKDKSGYPKSEFQFAALKLDTKDKFTENISRLITKQILKLSINFLQEKQV